MDVVFLIGRILLAVPFLQSGLMIHFSRQGVEYARGYNAPAPELMVPLSGAAIVAGGLSVALGIWGDLGALVLAAFALAILPFMHAFWREEDAQAQQLQLVNFVKNVSMAGARWSSSTRSTSSRGRPGSRSPTPSSAAATDPGLNRLSSPGGRSSTG